MVKVEFEYKDKYCFDGKFHKQSCVVSSVEECIKIYGLEEPDVEYHILSVKEN
jgi:hypothetical protein